MKTDDPAPRFEKLRPASEKATRAARATSRNKATAPERRLARALWAAGCRYRKNVKSLPGCPDLVFRRQRVVIFVDGDFWHGHNWSALKKKLERGHNANYWVAKIERNMRKDARANETLSAMGWTVLRFWESDIKHSLDAVVARTLVVLDAL